MPTRVCSEFSTRVNKPENDDPSIVEPIAIATVIVPPLRFWCGSPRYAHLTHLDCAVGVPFLWCCYR